MTGQQLGQNNWAFLCRWAAANLAGWMAGVLLLPLPVIGPILGPPLAGIAVGILQGFALRRYMGRTVWWAVAGGAGFIIAPPLYLLAFSQESSNYVTYAAAFILIIFGAGGLSAGALQWLLLPEQIRQVGWWIPANVVGFVLGGLVIIGAFNMLLVSASLLLAALTGLLAGGVYALTTGWILLTLLHPPHAGAERKGERMRRGWVLMLTLLMGSCVLARLMTASLFFTAAPQADWEVVSGKRGRPHVTGQVRDPDYAGPIRVDIMVQSMPENDETFSFMTDADGYLEEDIDIQVGCGGVFVDIHVPNVNRYGGKDVPGFDFLSVFGGGYLIDCAPAGG